MVNIGLTEMQTWEKILAGYARAMKVSKERETNFLGALHGSAGRHPSEGLSSHRDRRSNTHPKSNETVTQVGELSMPPYDTLL